MCVKELNDELMRTYHNRNFKADDLNDTRTNYNMLKTSLLLPRATSTTSRPSYTREMSN
jgi:hypothetical protein